jgi:hypothetical protein
MRRIIVNIALLVVTLVVALGLVEISLRAFYPIYFTGNIGAYRYDDKLGVRLKEDIHYFKTTDYQQEVLTNTFGSNNLQDTFTGYKSMIFAVGDSYTQGTGLPIDASYPFQLSMMLNVVDDEYVNNYGVINLGLDGYGTKQAILSLPLLQGIYGKPDYILYFGCSNDYLDDIMFEKGYRHKFLVDGSPYWGKMLKPMQWFTNDTEIGKRIKIAIGDLQRKSYKKNDKAKKQQVDSESTVTKEQSKKIKRLVAREQEEQLNKLLAVAREMDAQLIVSWAELPKSTPSSYSWLKQWAASNDVAFADWHPRTESILKAIPEIPSTNQHSGGHYRTWVNGVIARSFYEQIH